MAHPPPPWRLYGELIIVPALVEPGGSAAREQSAASPASRSWRRALGGVMLANYTSGTLVYRELIVFSHATARGMVVSHIYVDDEQSLSGGHEIWGLPKELATFEYTRTHFVARQETTLLEASIRRRPGFLPLVIPAPIVSDAGATLGIARIKAAPALVELDVPPASPFASLGLSGTRAALAGDDLALTMPAPS